MEDEIPVVAKRIQTVLEERRVKAAEQGIET